MLEKYCPECGTLRVLKDKFCSNCGRKYQAINQENKGGDIKNKGNAKRKILLD